LGKPVRRAKLLQMIARLLGEVTDDTAQPVGDGSGRIATQSSIREDMTHSARILLADDNPVNQKLATLILGKAGYQVDIARTGREAVARFTSQPGSYDLIFMDMQMPEMDGMTATRTLRRLGFADIPIVAMTAHAMKGVREMCLDVGMNDYITKPIKREIVFGVIDKFIFRRKFEKEPR